MVFQPPQASHLPDHLEWAAPQDWQTKEEDLAMISIIAWRVKRHRSGDRVNPDTHGCAA